MSDPRESCKAFLKAYRKVVGAKAEETVDKRYGAHTNGDYLAPNDKLYYAHCAYCAEVEYLQEIYSEE